jgi:hypothetical protein
MTSGLLLLSIMLSRSIFANVTLAGATSRPERQYEVPDRDAWR